MPPAFSPCWKKVNPCTSTAGVLSHSHAKRLCSHAGLLQGAGFSISGHAWVREMTDRSAAWNEVPASTHRVFQHPTSALEPKSHWIPPRLSSKTTAQPSLNHCSTIASAPSPHSSSFSILRTANKSLVLLITIIRQHFMKLRTLCGGYSIHPRPFPRFPGNFPSPPRTTRLHSHAA